MELQVQGQPSAFSRWLRRGRSPRFRTEVELKFNPWHDPQDGRFTFAGSGNYFPQSGAGQSEKRRNRTPAFTYADDPSAPEITTIEEAEAWRAGELAKHGSKPGYREAIDARHQLYLDRLPAHSVLGVSQAIDFGGGAAEAIYDIGRDIGSSLYSLATTDPRTSVANLLRGYARTIDAAITAEDTPAYVQIERGLNAISDASPRELGYGVGTVAGNIALVVAPGAALPKAATLHRPAMARSRTIYNSPQIGWTKETTKSDRPWKPYNDAATGARPSQAPTLMRTMADGSKRPVKFDGIQGDYLIDRKWKVVDAPRARAQILRQSEVLAEHRLIGTWEVPTSVQKDKALRLFKKMNITNIHVKVVKP